MFCRFAVVAAAALGAALAEGRGYCEGGDSRAWSSTLPGGAVVGWQMNRDLGACRRVRAVIAGLPTDAVEAARTLGELADVLMLAGGDFSRGDLIGFCVVALAGQEDGRVGNQVKVFRGRWNSATCRVADGELIFTLVVDTRGID